MKTTNKANKIFKRLSFVCSFLGITASIIMINAIPKNTNDPITQKRDVILTEIPEFEDIPFITGIVEIDDDIIPHLLYEEIPDLPDKPTNVYFFMDYDLYKPIDAQYKIQKLCLTEYETGIRYFVKDNIKYYCCALGGHYSITLGDAYTITLNNGNVFNVMLSEYKHDITKRDEYDYGDNCINYDKIDSVNVVEFLVDSKYIPFNVLDKGSYSCIEKFGGLYGTGGNIIDIKYVGNLIEGGINVYG